MFKLKTKNGTYLLKNFKVKKLLLLLRMDPLFLRLYCSSLMQLISLQYVSQDSNTTTLV